MGKYLGLPEHFGRKKRDLFTSIIDKIKQKGKSWSNRFLSKAGKLTMIKSVLSPVPSHAMQCFKLPLSLCKRIQAAVTKFWWDDKEGERKMAWVSWDKMTQPKEIGGLGVREFQAFNDGFLGKLSWIILNNPDILLSRVLLGKYSSTESFLEVTAKSSISHGWRGVLVGRDLLKENLGWVVGNGSSIRVWDDPWLSLTSQSAPFGPATEATSSLTVSDLFLENSMEWNQELIRQVLPLWENIIMCIKPSLSGAPDKLVWLGTQSGAYTTKSGYHRALKKRTEEGENANNREGFNWFKGVWSLNTSPKIKLFLWRLFQQALPVGEVLMSRHLTTDAICKRCGTLESIDHLFIQCSFARNIWEAAPFVGTLDLSGSIDLNSVWLSLCDKFCLPPSGISTSQLAPWILWHIWTARNKLIFTGKVMSAEETLSQAIAQAREWLYSQDKHPGSTKKKTNRVTIPENCVRINIDAAWKVESKIAGLG